MCARRNVLRAILAAALLMSVFTGTTTAKSVYLCAEHHQALFDAWTIKPDGTVEKQATYNLQHSTDPAGIAIDNDSQTIFITSEFSPGVEMVDPVTLTYLGVSSGPRDLAGIDVDDVDDIVYTVKRMTDDLYIYKWDPVAKTMTQLAQINLPNCSQALGLALDESADILWVADAAAGVVRAYDVDVVAWSDIAEIPAMNFTPAHKPVDVAVDTIRDCVYTVSIIGGAWLPPGAGSTLLCKYDLTTATETTVDMGHGGVGVAVDEVTGYVYVTGGASAGDNMSVWDTSTSPFTEICDTGDIGNPAGICIANISYNPLKLAKNDVIVGEVYIGSKFTYELTYENTNTFDVTNVTILDFLPPEVDFVSATHDGGYDEVTHAVLWDIGTVPAGTSGPTIELVVKVTDRATPGSTIYNYAVIEADGIPPTTVIDDEGSGDPGDEPGTPIGESILVSVDVKPGSFPSSVNLKNKGLTPVAIHTTDDFDAADVDAASVKLEDCVTPVRWNLSDCDEVPNPLYGILPDEPEMMGDGDTDLVLFFDTGDLTYLGDVTEVTLTGLTAAGVPVVGTSDISFVKQGKP